MQAFARVLVVALIAVSAADAQPRDRERVNGERVDEVQEPLVVNPIAVVHFDSGEAEVPSRVDDALGDAAAWLAEHPQRMLIVEGHADRAGSWRSNLRLSQQRAEAVRDRLVLLGADPLRIVESAHSENEPAADPRRSRRVEVRGTVHTYAELIEEQRPRRRARR